MGRSEGNNYVSCCIMTYESVASIEDGKGVAVPPKCMHCLPDYTASHFRDSILCSDW